GYGKVYGRHGDPVVRNREVEFDAERRPSPAVPDLRLLDGRVRVEHGLAADLIDAGVDVAADVRQDRALEVFVFEEKRAPGDFLALVGQTVPDGIGVIEFGRGENVERGIRVGWTFESRGQG